MFYICVFLSIIIYYTIVIYRKILEIIEHKRQINQKITNDTATIKNFLDYDLSNANLNELKENIQIIKSSRFKDKIVSQFKPEIDKKLTEAYKTIKELEFHEKIKNLKTEKAELEGQIKTLSYLKKIETQTDEEKIEELKENLDIPNKNVFIIEDLCDDEYNILKDEGFKQVNEYDVLAQDMVTCLVKQVMNHSMTHTFLVWSVKRLLENIFEVEDIVEHETRDADITFKYNNKTYALEIETDRKSVV